MALNGLDNSGPMGLKSITTWLNDHNVGTRDGGRFGIAAVHQILTRTTYIGQHRFNYRDFRTKARKPEAEHAVMDVPPIVTEAEFDAVQRSLKARNPMVMPPRAVSGPTLLTGICFCSLCGGAMTLRTGHSSTGQEYRYYTCSTKARQGPKGCPGITIPMARLDQAVIHHLESRLLDPQRLEALMEQLLERRDEWVDRRRSHVSDLRRRATEADAKLKGLYDAIENGVINANDPSLKDRIAELATTRDQAGGDADRVAAAIERVGPVITAESLQAFALAAKQRLRTEEGAYRRDHLRAVAQRVEVVTYLSGTICDLCLRSVQYGNGAPERIRTSDPQIRSLVLYPAELRAPSQGRRTYWGSRAKASGPFRFWHAPGGQSSSIVVALRQVPAPPTDFGDLTVPAPLSRAMGVGKSGGGPGAVVFRVCWACDMRANMRRKSQEHGRG